MKLLFWNTNKMSQIEKYAVSMVEEHDVDIVVFSELMEPVLMDEALRSYNNDFYKCNTIGCTRINMWSSGLKIAPADQNARYSINILENNFILCCVHLQSDMSFDHSRERHETIRQIMEDINACAERTSIDKIIIIGDMNEMPYGDGCLSANGFHGLPELTIHEDANRIVCGKKYRKYYNPMWNMFGDNSKPPGTYYLRQSRLKEPMWYILDQVIISQEVIPFFERDSLSIINNTTAGRLDNKMGRPKVSDHFPIICEIKGIIDED